MHSFLQDSCSRVMLPAANLAIRLLERFDQAVSRLCPPLTAGAVLLSTYWSALTYGYFTVLEVVGLRRGAEWVDASEPLVRGSH